MAPFLVSFFVILLAELGDKTQLLTIGFSLRYPIWKVISAISLATFILMALAVTFGKAISYYVPAFYIQIFSGLVFVFFGLMILFSREENNEGKIRSKRSTFWLIFSTFFIAELADKTQLAAFVLSAKYNAPWQVWLGATLGMLTINCLAIFLSSWIKKFASEASVKWVGGIVFIIFGIATLINSFI